MRTVFAFRAQEVVLLYTTTVREAMVMHATAVRGYTLSIAACAGGESALFVRGGSGVRGRLLATAVHGR